MKKLSLFLLVTVFVLPAIAQKLLCLQHEKLPLSTEGTLLKFSFC